MIWRWNNYGNGMQQEPFALLSPLLERNGERRPALACSINTERRALCRIERGGAAELFIRKLVAASAKRFGVCEPAPGERDELL